jgi:hypothetical protein
MAMPTPNNSSAWAHRQTGRTILGIVLREVERKLGLATPESPNTITRLKMLLARAECIRTK